MTGIQVISFDMGHTLVLPRYEEYARLLEGLAPPTDEHSMQQLEGTLRPWFDEQVAARGLVDGIWKEYYARFLTELGLPQEHLESVLIGLRDRYREGIGLWTVPAPGARETLEALRGLGFTVICVSNNDGRLRRMVAYQGWEPLFDLLVDSEEVGLVKPDPAIFHLTAEQLGLPTSTILHIGDYYSVDVLGARSAGAHGVLYDPISAYGEMDCPVVTDLLQLPALLEGQHGSG